MIFGEHLTADEAAVPCACGCGVAAVVQVLDGDGRSCGWFTRSCAYRRRKELRRMKTIARAVLNNGRSAR